MPLIKCTLNGGQGWKWGETGKCYPTQSEALERAKTGSANRSKDEKPELVDEESELTSAELTDGVDIDDLAARFERLQGFLEAKIPDLATKSDVRDIVYKAIKEKLEGLPKPATLSNKQIAVLVSSGVALITAITTVLTNLL